MKLCLHFYKIWLKKYYGEYNDTETRLDRRFGSDIKRIERTKKFAEIARDAYDFDSLNPANLYSIDCYGNTDDFRENGDVGYRINTGLAILKTAAKGEMRFISFRKPTPRTMSKENLFNPTEPEKVVAEISGVLKKIREDDDEER